MFEKGQIVYSKNGRDKGRAFIVVDFDNEYLFLVDGQLRKLEKPKKKKIKHVQSCKKVEESIKYKIENNLYLNDADVRKALAAYMLSETV